ncbi:beta-L-arabinofuranosidase domain-containing protein [Streptomyces sp. S465]|uniref:beta-L-arabinofuranosidase domain-containing protein n=1 Tax=Streptomyces sp. S465 TaxID=2979468 RepID=UPI0022A88CA2|nr:beta-L-arabinofuranosidase domain-containing protein [Streptomyces sp. S465]WAP60567.1 glycoside hydrolase family 127 protein [Streptomyces sp. S465]
MTGGGHLDLRLRVPYWAERGFTVRVNGVRQRVDATPGGYVSLKRTWRTGDRVEIAAPFTLRIERAAGRTATVRTGCVVTRGDLGSVHDVVFTPDTTNHLAHDQQLRDSS